MTENTPQKIKLKKITLNELAVMVVKGFFDIGDRLTGVEDRLTKVEDRLTAVEDKLTVVEDRLTIIENRLAGVESRLTSVEIRLTNVENNLLGMQSILIHDHLPRIAKVEKALHEEGIFVGKK